MVEEYIALVCSWIWGWPMIVLLLGTHLFLTVRLRFPQRRLFTAIRLSVRPDKKGRGDVTPFGALSTALAATIGTGNIIGVATAVALGGPGAVFWCWLTGVLGFSTKYAEALLAVKYRVVTSDGTMAGGPMYVLEKGLGLKWLAVLFAIFTAIAALGIGNTVQANSIATLMNESFGVAPAITGAGLALLTALVILFGIGAIARFCSYMVPFMAGVYVLGCLAILVLNSQFLPETFSAIFLSAFSAKAFGSGLVGASVLSAIRYGVARGLFSNEAGLGSAPIVAAAAQTRNPVRQALVSATGTFWDTVVVCALTGLVLVSSVIAHPDIDYSQGAILTKLAFDKIPVLGSPLLLFGLLTFTFSTILGWSYYGEKAIEYLGGKRVIVLYRWIWIGCVFLGAVANLQMIWNLADIMNGLMAIPNLVALLLLSKVASAETDRYLWGGRLGSYDNNGPVQQPLP